ncbi:hypothetical protein AcV7_007516 [Taiwanofungus camphoratus]|nr:hypothetical protein AcV7_007516 [Antrodia cinnamomea]
MTTNSSGAPAGGNTFGQKIKGAGEVIHGVGDNLRGRFLDAVDDGTKTGGGHAETERGRMETEKGMSRMTGSTYGPGTGATTGPGTGAMTGSGTGATTGQGTGTETGPGTGATTSPGTGAMTGTGTGAVGADTGVAGGAGTADTKQYNPSGAAGAAGATPVNADSSGGTGGTMTQGQYEGEYPSQGTTQREMQGGQNNRGFQPNHGGQQNQSMPRQGGVGPGVDYTNSGTGTSMPSDGPQRRS